MSIVIKGIEMPKTCFECPFMYHRQFCYIKPEIDFYKGEKYEELTGRHKNCPLVENNDANS
jgi:hypothetical protein